MKLSPLENFRKRAAFDENLNDGEKVMITQISHIVFSERTPFPLTMDDLQEFSKSDDPLQKIILVSRRTLYTRLTTYLRLGYLEYLKRWGNQPMNFYRLKTDNIKRPNPMLIRRVRLRLFPWLNSIAAIRGAQGGSKPKKYSTAETTKRTMRIKAERKKFLAEKRIKK